MNRNTYRPYYRRNYNNNDDGVGCLILGIIVIIVIILRAIIRFLTPIVFIYCCIVIALICYRKSSLLLPLSFGFLIILLINNYTLDIDERESLILLINLLYYGIFAFKKISNTNNISELEKQKNNFYLLVYSFATILLIVINFRLYKLYELFNSRIIFFGIELLFKRVFIFTFFMGIGVKIYTSILSVSLLLKIFFVVTCFIGFVGKMYDAIMDEYHNDLDYLLDNRMYYFITFMLCIISTIMAYSYLSIYYLIYWIMYLFPYRIIACSNPNNIKNMRKLKNSLTYY